jgi:3-dehydroquinate dehydratase-2
MNILFLNGPNLDLLGEREPEIYGKESLSDVEDGLRRHATSMKASGILDHATVVTWAQTNSESDFLNWITKESWTAIVVNPGAWSHFNYAIADRLMAVRGRMTLLEVHLSNIHARESFRQKSVTAKCCHGVITGMGSAVYRLALEYLAMENSQPA